MVRGSTLLLVLLAATACDDDGRLESDDVYMDDDVPAGSCMTGTGDDCDTEGTGDGATTNEVAGTCESTLECDDGEVCIATFDGDIGEFECRGSCIGDMDETQWCLDDEGCCEATSICNGRGYCIPGDAADTTGA
jgi:hypothetical protein